MSNRYFTVAVPWRSNSHKKVLLYNRTMPVAHAASIMGLTKQDLLGLCASLNIQMAPRPVDSKFDSFVHVGQFPRVLRAIKWSNGSIDRAMKQLYQFLDSSPVSGEPSQEEEEEEEQQQQQVVVVPEEDEAPVANDASQPAWALRLEQKIEKAVGQCIAMTRARAIPAYWASQMWKDEKDALIQARLDKMMPKIVEHERKRIASEMTKEIEQEIRDRKEKEKMDEVELMASAIQKKPKTINFEEPEIDPDEEVLDYLKQHYNKNQTE